MGDCNSKSVRWYHEQFLLWLPKPCYSNLLFQPWIPRWFTVYKDKKFESHLPKKYSCPIFSFRLFFSSFFRYIMEFEGPGALFKGLGPNLVGVAPSRAIYFCSYSQSKQFFNSFLRPDTPIVHICSAACAGKFLALLTLFFHILLLRPLSSPLLSLLHLPPVSPLLNYDA